MFLKVDNTILKEARVLLLSQVEAHGKIFCQVSAVNNDVKSP